MGATGNHAALHRKRNYIDKFGLPTDNFHAKIDTLTASDLRAMHRAGRAALKPCTEHRKDQYNRPVQIPENALLFDFKRRFANYKRPYMPFTNPKALRQILVDYNAYYIWREKSTKATL